MVDLKSKKDLPKTNVHEKEDINSVRLSLKKPKVSTNLKSDQSSDEIIILKSTKKKDKSSKEKSSTPKRKGNDKIKSTITNKREKSDSLENEDELEIKRDQIIDQDVNMSSKPNIAQRKNELKPEKTLPDGHKDTVNISNLTLSNKELHPGNSSSLHESSGNTSPESEEDVAGQWATEHNTVLTELLGKVGPLNTTVIFHQKYTNLVIKIVKAETLYNS